MADTFGAFELADVRFPTSRELDGSDAMNPDPDYSLAHLTLPTTAADAGNGFVFTIGRGTEIVVTAIRALEHHLLGRDVGVVLADSAGCDVSSSGTASSHRATARASSTRPWPTTGSPTARSGRQIADRPYRSRLSAGHATPRRPAPLPLPLPPSCPARRRSV